MSLVEELVYDEQTNAKLVWLLAIVTAVISVLVLLTATAFWGILGLVTPSSCCSDH